jgi:deoxyadenosine/deoxycytidine kinase
MYVVEGNIGVGKTTFLSSLKKYRPNIDILAEPLDCWNNQTYGQSLLENFYRNTARWAYTLETLTMMCRAREHIRKQGDPNKNRIFERSIYSGHYCFAKNSFKNGHMTKIEWHIYNQWVDFLVHSKCKPPLGFIYLKASPEICFKRVQKRNRSSEKGLTLSYIKQIDFCHNQFLIEKKDLSPALKRVPVLVLDCNKDFVKDEKNMASHARKVALFFQHTQPIIRTDAATEYQHKNKNF